MVHKPKHKVHSFRGLLADGGQEEINIERSNVNLAYRIVKFEAMATAPGADESTNVLKIYKDLQSSIDEFINFDDTTLMAAIDFRQHDNEAYGVTATTVIFDNVLFSLNIYITHKDKNVGVSINYYLEIEEVPVNASTLMQLKLGTARRLSLSESAPDA